MTSETRNKLINDFNNKLKAYFKNRLSCIIGYGSFFNKQNDKINDIDMIIILKDYLKNDLDKIAEAKRSSHLKTPLHAQILYETSMPKTGSYYSINTCGSFFLYKILKSGKLLYGRNIFRKITRPNQLILLLSVLQKLQQYNYQFKNTYINKLATKQKIDMHFINKKIACIKEDMRILRKYTHYKKSLFSFEITQKNHNKTTRQRLCNIIEAAETTQSRLYNFLKIKTAAPKYIFSK